jgi:hypothetical protein
MFPSAQAPTLTRRLSVLAVVVSLGVPAVRAQSGISEVHIQPRVQPSVREGLGNIYRNTIRTNVDLVLVPVTVTDTMNRIVVGLQPRNFQLYEG